MKTFAGRLGLQQRVLPIYRVAFFDSLAQICQKGLSVFAGKPLSGEGIVTANDLKVAHLFKAQNWHLFSPESPYYLCWQAGILRWLKQWQPDVLVVEANPRYLSTLLAVRWMHKRGKPVIAWGLGVVQGGRSRDGLRDAWRRCFAHQFDAIISYSNRGAKSYRELGFPAERIFVAPNSVMPKPHLPPPSRPLQTKERLNILFVGRLQSRKRVDHLLFACAELPEPLQPNLWIVGDGPTRGEFEELAHSVYPRTTFFGARFGTELDAIFKAADLFVLPGTGGLAVQQAMYYALPVIVAEGDGTQEDLVQSENGWLVPPDDLAALRRVLQEALSDVNRLRLMGLESYRIVCEKANIEAMRDVFLDVLERVISTTSSPIDHRR